MVLLSLFLSKFVGFSLIFFSIFLKLPQIYKIIKRKKIKSLSTTSVLLEIAVNCISYCYHRVNGFPISTYGETIIILAQNVIIGFLVFHISPNHSIIFWDIYISHIFFLIFCVETHSITILHIRPLWMICGPLSQIQKIPQIYVLMCNKATEEISVLSSFLVFGGAMGRLFTNILEIKDIYLLSLNITSCVLNGTIFSLSFLFSKQ